MDWIFNCMHNSRKSWIQYLVNWFRNDNGNSKSQVINKIPQREKETKGPIKTYFNCSSCLEGQVKRGGSLDDYRVIRQPHSGNFRGKNWLCFFSQLVHLLMNVFWRSIILIALKNPIKISFKTFFKTTYQRKNPIHLEFGEWKHDDF